ncbi:hypothetical protein TcasGA2_TC034553 [Tribolium castaneum]|uniref:EB domain-containing protein n=1 Tax=Tribolium castaneum TaxID=7070 RepID=A0A139WMB4_TRICA|nr:PREDICTED: uncharacterized protein LOC103313584 [Tribolium castaneum]KYB29179.1 hypothetical protein TcasGA2_TC034553 [Tribolium castaneum]|eukprot:XP_008195422.1 PREDICTED: uncharacterized protein LOC103313584 [Tribolium castaneum]
MKTTNFCTCIFLTFLTDFIASQKTPVVSRTCVNKYDCGAAFGYICGHNQTCRCDRNYILNSYGDKCVGGVGQRCRYDEHCIEGAFCQFQIKCECKDELYPSENGLACSRSKQIVNAPRAFEIAIFLFYVLKVS